uniref:Secreted protein n=1 Tax=Romanomermis culicivorax TaxID=13658 RepID=A0A915L118_ROMCU
MLVVASIDKLVIMAASSTVCKRTASTSQRHTTSPRTTSAGDATGASTSIPTVMRFPSRIVPIRLDPDPNPMFFE